ncbi:MAG: glycosyltransferase family protein [Desulfotomaculales bacterium]
MAAFNAMGIDFTVENRSLYDFLGVPFVALMVDHPMYHIQRLSSDAKNLIVTFVDRTHLNFMSNYFSYQKNSFFLPHGGCYVPGSQSKQYNDREIAVLYAGSYDNPDKYRQTWMNSFPVLAGLMDDIVEVALAHHDVPLVDIVAEVFAYKGVCLDQIASKSFVSLLPLVDKFIRARRREAVLNRLSRMKTKICLFGTGWDQFAHNGHLLYLGNANFTQVLESMGKARVVMNVNPNFPDGSHERVFSAMLNGAVCLSDRNKYLSQEFIEGKDIIFYSWDELDQLPYIVEDILNDKERAAAIAAAGKRKAEDSHTWDSRARDILQIVNAMKLLWSIKTP